MLVSGTSTSSVLVDGTILEIDPIVRTVMIMHPSGPLTFDVPVWCEIYLNDERVKFRLLQPRDKVHLTFSCQHGFLTAMKLAVTTRRSERNGAGPEGHGSLVQPRLSGIHSGDDLTAISPSQR